MTLVDSVSRVFEKNRFVVAISWQICSLVMCASGIICNYLSIYYIRTIPFLMLSITYTILFLVSVWKVPKSETSWWKYFFVSAMIIIGDYTAVEGYNSTSLTSSLLLVTTVVFWVAPLSYLVFGRKINIFQFGAILLGMTGSLLAFISEGTKNNKWIGNIMALTSAICYSFGTVMMELLIHSDSMHTYLCRFSGCSAMISIIMTAVFERDVIVDYYWCTESVLLVVGYGALLALYDIIASFVMQFSDATLMNLSMLTENFFSLGVYVVFFGLKAKWLYLIGFSCVPTAIAIFSIFGPRFQKNDSSMQALLSQNDVTINTVD